MTEGSGTWLDSNTLQFERLLDASLEEVWAMIVEPHKRSTWLAGGEWELRPGGRAELVFRNDLLLGSDASSGTPPDRESDEGAVRFVGEVIEVNRPTMIELSFPEPGGQPSRIRFELTATGERVRLVVTQFNLDSSDQWQATAAGWHAHLDRLHSLLGDLGVRPFADDFADAERIYAEIARR